MHSSILALVAVLACKSQLTSAQQVFATQCYYKSDNTFHLAAGGPCGVITANGNFTSCCSIGDECIADGLCHYTHARPDPPSVGTGYYVGGCNDRSLNSPACNPACNDLDLTDIVYNQTTNSWHCCESTNGVIHCDNPTNEVFSAPPPNQLSATYTVPATAVTGAASSTSSGASATSTPGSSSGGGLSTGAKAGIGIGAAVGGFAVIGALAWFILRQRKRKGHAISQKSDNELKAGPYTDHGAGGGVGAFGGHHGHGHPPSSPGYQSTYAPTSPAPQYGATPGEYMDGSHNTAATGVPKDGMSASLGGGPIEGVGANGAPVEKMSDNVAATQPQEMGESELRRGRSVRYEME